MFTRRTVLSCLVVAALGSAVWLAGCSEAKDPWEGKPSPHVLVTIPPLYSFAKNVAGDHGAVISLCTETGPHHYEASTTDLRTLRGATVFFTVGLGLDDKFTEPMVNTTGKKDVRVELGEKLPDDLKRKPRPEPMGEGANQAPDHHGEFDPHVWLGPTRAVEMVGLIRDELKKADKDHAKDYDQNAKAYVKELEKLHADGVEKLKGGKVRIISFHDSLEYFAKDFGIEIVDVIEKGPGQEPGGKEMRELVQKCVDKDVRIIAVEPQYPKTSAAATILAELKKKGKTDVALVEIDPLETAKANELSAELYVKTMRQNLKNLSDKLP
jgi:ABC-type Zn uptake system ZnuABC Zn-binding protein ZnuA